MLESLSNLIRLILTGDYQPKMFGWYEDSWWLEPIYFVHQNPELAALLLIGLLVLIIGVLMVKAK